MNHIACIIKFQNVTDKFTYAMSLYALDNDMTVP
jgi:hypothetical protein